jgi:hypothetical protein
MAAPAYPPIKAWEELLGRPKYQVMRFQETAPRSPHRITVGVTEEISIIPLPMVAATVVPNTRKAIKLKNAAQTTASLGDKTRVETIVDMELAASCIPLVKSKANAMIIMIIMNSRFKFTSQPLQMIEFR